MNNNPNENVNQQTTAGQTPNVVPVGNTQQAASATTVTPVSEPVKSGPVPPQQNRVQLIDDKPKIHAVMGNNGQAIPTTEKKEEVPSTPPVTPPAEGTTAVVEEKKGGKAQTFFLFLLFGGLFALVIFLPDISSYIETQKYLKEQQVVEKITTGTLECTMESGTSTLDYTHELSFGFTDNKLTRLTFVTETRGDISLDEVELDTLKAECDQLALNAKALSGVSVSCSLENGLLTKKQTFNYASVSVDAAITAYVEAGGAYPDYENGENIDDIEKEMNASGYTCERVK